MPLARHGSGNRSSAALHARTILGPRAADFVWLSPPKVMRANYSVAPSPVPGDGNGDGQVTVADAVLAVRFALRLGTPSAAALRAGDLSCDGRIDVPDVVLLLRKLV